jgi:hypothetical protein
MDRKGTLIEERDERLHDHGDLPGWSERLQFCFFDISSGFGGIARVDVRTPDKRADGTLSVFMPGGALATVFAKAATGPGDGLSVDRILLDPEEPLTRWRIRCKDIALVFPNAGAHGLPRAGERHGSAAPIDLDLTFDAWMPPAGAVERKTEVNEAKFVNVVSTGHFEQAGRFTGRVRIGKRQAAIDGSGIRDRTWGPIDPTAAHASRWFAAAFSPSLAFGVRGVSLGFQDLHSGWVLRDGVVREVKGFRLETENEGRTVKALRLSVTDAEGDIYTLDGESICTLPLREGSARVNQSMTRFRLSDRETLGLAEFVDRG